jgi:hypothetical protein
MDLNVDLRTQQPSTASLFKSPPQTQERFSNHLSHYHSHPHVPWNWDFPQVQENLFMEPLPSSVTPNATNACPNREEAKDVPSRRNWSADETKGFIQSLISLKEDAPLKGLPKNIKDWQALFLNVCE